MRTNSTKKIHQMKRDPYKTLLRTVVILLIVVAAGAGIYWLCTQAVYSDYYAKRDALEQENAEAEIEFNARMNALRSSAATTIDPDTGEVTAVDLPSWEVELDSATWRLEDQSNLGLENTRTITLDRASLINGGMLLVNQWHPLPADFSDEGLLSVGTTSGFKIQVEDASVRLFPEAYNAINNLIEDALLEGQEHYMVRAGYRSMADQQALFDAEVASLQDRYSGQALINKAMESVNYPGTSEYQTGLSFRMDIYSRDTKLGKFSVSDQGRWFNTNCWKYGIIFRFPVEGFPTGMGWEDKSYKTGITSTLNIYRYVGTPHATVMRMMDMCMEEYVEFLIEHPHVAVYENGSLRYEIIRIGANDSEQSFALPVPNPASSYQASFDNMGGIVMAYTY